MAPAGDITAHDLLLSFSEWLDTEGLTQPPTDDRSHDDLAGEYLNSIEGTPLGEWAGAQL